MRRALPLLLATVAPAQDRSSTVLRLHDPAGAPVADATATLFLGPRLDLPALRGAVWPGPPLDPAYAPGTVTATSRADGEVRLGDPAAPRPGAVLVQTDQGLGAFVPEARPRQAQRVVLQPQGAVALSAERSEAFVLHAAWREPGRPAVRLGTTWQRAAVAKPEWWLPAGDYELWLDTTDGWEWRRLTIGSGQRTVLVPSQAQRRVQLAAPLRVAPDGWSDLELLSPQRPAAVLRGAARQATLLTHDLRTGAIDLRQLPDDATREPLPWHAAGSRPLRTVPLRLDGAPVAAQAFLLRRLPQGEWRPLAATQTDGDGNLHLPDGSGGDDWLLVLAAGAAPHAEPWPPEQGVELALPRGVPLQVRCRDQRGEPIADLAVEYVGERADAAAVAAASDGRGRLDLGRQVAPGTLRIVDQRFANQTHQLRLIPTLGLDLVVDPGATVQGTVRMADGGSAAGVLVTLRDPRGQLRPGERAERTRADGTFAFAGLEPTADYVLFATAMRDGRTWSAKLPRVPADGTAVELVLADEDPQLGRREQPAEPARR